MKKAMSSESKEHKDQGQTKSKKKWFGKNKATDLTPKQPEAIAENATTSTTQPPPPVQDSRRSTEIEEMQKQHTSSIAIATAKAAEAAMAAAQAAAELARLTNTPRIPVKLTEEAASVRIQTAFRAYTARRALRALRGSARMKNVMQGPSVKRQTANALRCMQTLARVQSEIRARRLRTTEENQARQRQLLDKHGKELHKLQNLQKNEDEWNASGKSKEHIQTRLQNKREAAIKRERALAYSFNHQRTWRNSETTKPAQTMFMESINPHWGWSWLERWLAEKPWEIAAPINPDLAPLRSSLNATPSGSQIAKALLYHVTEKQQTQSATSSPRSSLRSPRSATAPRMRNSTGRLSTSSTPRAQVKARIPARARGSPKRGSGGNEDAVSIQSEQNRRRSNAGDLDNESLASSPADGGGGAVVPSYMAPTESARARSRLGSPNSADRMSACSGRRRVSYPSSPARSRQSTSSITDANSVGDGK
ncbi:hypothetical protein V2J09_020713 [Rumex salicifolius]